MIETRTEKIWLADNGIMWYKAKPVHEHMEEDAYENIIAARTLTKGEAYPSFIDIRDARFVSSKARRLYISKENDSVSACALLVGSPVSRMVGNFFMGINRPVFPTRLFTSQKEALRWLESFCEKK